MCPEQCREECGCSVGDCVLHKESIRACGGTLNDCGHTHHEECYCDEDQGGGYTYSDEYGPCAFCNGEFEVGETICADQHNQLRICPLGLIDGPGLSHKEAL